MPNKGKTVTRHGMCKTPEYMAWIDACRRCGEHPKYLDIQCSLTFEEWFDELGLRPAPHPTDGPYSVDRIDNLGHYERGNIHWATKKQQERNKSSSIYITYQDKTQTLLDWCNELGLKYRTIHSRIHSGRYTPIEALTVPRGKRVD